LQLVRERDLDVPVILITGAPTVETATRAIEHGAFRYLMKPVKLDDLYDLVRRAVQLNQIARAKREAVTLLGPLGKLVGDRAGLQASFTRALAGIFMAYQPIIEWSQRRVFGYEALLRCKEPSLPHPGAILEAAERLGRVTDVGRAVRNAVAQGARQIADANIFVNLHPLDLLDESLASKDGPLASIANRVVLEITERDSLDDIPDARGRVARVREMGFSVAVDDLGAGYAGLTSFAQLEPEVVKLDMGLVRNIHNEPTKQKVVGAMTGICREMGMLVVAEGIETPEERDCVVALGCDLLQGYLFARPSWPIPSVNW
jgi:EAL domain-containing protein (putative c-di-GMP-specific phosphodiesterase class I)